MQNIEEKKKVLNKQKVNYMQDLIIKKIRNVKLKNPVFIEGLPGIGLVGKLSCEYIIKKLKMQKIMEIYSPYLPPEVEMKSSGIVKPISYDFYHTRISNIDYLILTGDAQPSNSVGQFILNKRIVEYVAKFKPKLIITLGGYATGKLHKNEMVYAAATNEKLVKKYCKFMKFGGSPGHIFGAAGQLLMFGMMKNIPSICIMGATHGTYVDARASKAVLGMLNKILSLKIDLNDFKSQIKETDKLIKSIETEIKQLEGINTPKKLPEWSYL